MAEKLAANGADTLPNGMQKPTFEQLQAAVVDLNDQVESLKSQIGAKAHQSGDDLAKAHAQINRLARQLNALAQQINQLAVLIEAKDAEIAKLKSDQADKSGAAKKPLRGLGGPAT